MLRVIFFAKVTFSALLIEILTQLSLHLAPITTFQLHPVLPCRAAFVSFGQSTIVLQASSFRQRSLKMMQEDCLHFQGIGNPSTHLHWQLRNPNM